MNCKHKHFEADVEVTRLAENTGDYPTGFIAEITVKCADCGEDFHFPGVDYGSSPDCPKLSADGLTLRAPIRAGELFIFEGQNEVIELGEIE